MARFVTERGDTPVFIGRFMVVGDKFKGGGRTGGRTGEIPPADLGDTPETGEYKFKLGGPWTVFFGGPWETFHTAPLPRGYGELQWSGNTIEEGVVISSSGREDVLLLLLRGFRLVFCGIEAAWNAVVSCNLDSALSSAMVGDDMLAGMSKVKVVGVYGPISGSNVIWLVVGTTRFPFTVSLPLSFFLQLLRRNAIDFIEGVDKTTGQIRRYREHAAAASIRGL